MKTTHDSSEYDGDDDDDDDNESVNGDNVYDGNALLWYFYYISVFCYPSSCAKEQL